MATIVVSADRVIAACNAKIKSILQEREKHVLRALTNVYRKPITLFGFVIVKEICTPEAAIAYLEDKNASAECMSRYYIGYWLALQHKEDTIYKLQALKYLAQSGDPVTLNQDDCAMLRPYL